MRNINLGNTKTFNTILKLAIPSMIAQLVSVLYNIVDRIYVGNMPGIGSIALVGIGVCAPITTFITSFAFLVGLGGAPLFSMSLGEKNELKAKKILSNALLMLVILSVVIMACLYPFLDQILFLFGASTESFPYAKDYISIYLTGTFFSILTLGLNQFLTAQGQSVGAMLTTIIGCVLNVILDPIFIYVFNFGAKGAAIATVVCQFVSFIFVLFLLLKKTKIRLSVGSYSLKTMWRIIVLGFSPFVIIATDSIIIIALNTVLQKYGNGKGDFYIQVATIVQAFESLITGPLLGISSGTQPVLGYLYGAKETKLIKKAEKQITLFALAFTTLCFILSFVFSKPFAAIFLGLSNMDQNQSQLVIDYSVKYIRYYMYGIIPLSFQYVFVDGLTGMGQAKYSIWLSLNRKIVLLLPIIIIFPIITKDATSAFLAEPIADIISGVVTSVVFLIIVPKILRRQETSKEQIEV